MSSIFKSNLFVYQKTLMRIYIKPDFDQKITFINSPHENTNSKGGYVL